LSYASIVVVKNFRTTAGAADVVYFVRRTRKGRGLVGFSEMLNRLREKAGLTQAALARRAGLSLRTVQSWEQGRRSPVSADFFKLVKALGVSADEFAGMADGEGPRKAGPVAKPRRRPKRGG
jgi:DNA-binding XRE family transcriptional regulator